MERLFCKLQENSPQIHADFVAQVNADQTHKIEISADQPCEAS
jgi:hypothetical protein